MRMNRNMCVRIANKSACVIRVCFPRAAEKGSVALSQRKYTASENMPVQRTGLSLVGSVSFSAPKPQGLVSPAAHLQKQWQRSRPSAPPVIRRPPSSIMQLTP